VSILAAMDVMGFLWLGNVDGNFTRLSFHNVFKEKKSSHTSIAGHYPGPLSSWTMPRFTCMKSCKNLFTQQEHCSSFCRLIPRI
jgi:hypothetical protein